MNEMQITSDAKAKQLSHVIHLQSVHMAPDHMALKLPQYALDFRAYLRGRRCPKDLNIIFIQIIQGLQELRELGFAHRDLKPENVVLNLEPLHAVLIDFNRSAFSTATTKGDYPGTPGYIPD
jgi:serine/threonine protein kinase